MLLAVSDILENHRLNKNFPCCMEQTTLAIPRKTESALALAGQTVKIEDLPRPGFSDSQ
jgi:hypothetical protein